MNLAYLTGNRAAIADAVPSLVQLLGTNSSPEVQKNAAGVLYNLAQNADHNVKIAAACAIPPLVQLLGPGSTAGVQQYAAGALGTLAQINDNAVAIAAAGAIPPLVQLLGPGSDDVPTEFAALKALGHNNATNIAAIAAAGASADVDVLEEMERLGVYDDDEE
ncbi:hypothetical protein FOA52_007258 [Chlamydomonas sp. UWO 241]|nr:hypothetical protein FOA52_007258 [Chlamydomonas sp. UWO 241]